MQPAILLVQTSVCLARLISWRVYLLKYELENGFETFGPEIFLTF